ncbi:unnamed protein product [Nezara viridula]|uniref:deoxyribose-phosphate aldolase n=1 Tax=Nezara viridula TaxID=85310 RepID=A0A9P0HJ15_NEZVI|nr:unnamed protein product [Nezara viridula]
MCTHTALKTPRKSLEQLKEQDSVPAHKARSSQQWLQKNIPEVIPASDWSSGSPVLNSPNYLLWSELERMACHRAHPNLESDRYDYCTKLAAVHPISKPILCSFAENREEFEFLKKITVAAVCVYPSRVEDAVKQLKLLDSPLPVASVATGFPSGQYPLTTRVDEVSFCVQNGASEVDIVIDRSLVLSGRWGELHEEVHKMKEACGEAHLKAILAVGECGSPDNIYKASMACMMAGADFIKTSTGKEVINANLPAGLVMCRAIRDFYRKTNAKVSYLLGYFY